MTYGQAILLGFVQGVAEFLPISSSGHLAVLQNFLAIGDMENHLLFDVLLHLGTLAAVFLALRGEISPAVERGAADAAPEKDAARRAAGRREAADDLVFDRGDAAAGTGHGAEQIRREPVSEHVFHRLCLFDDGRAALRGRPHGPRQQK